MDLVIIVLLSFLSIVASETVLQHHKLDVDNFLEELGGKEVAPSKHDHGGHMMKMWFHGGYDEVILFDFWRPNSLFHLLLSCAVVFIMGAIYEGVKWFRVYVLTRNQTGNSRRSQSEPFIIGSNSSRINNLPFSLIQGLLYIVQLILAYFLMLIVMTYNTYLTIAVVIGAGFGHWLFAVLQLRNGDGDVETRDSFQTDACH